MMQKGLIACLSTQGTKAIDLMPYLVELRCFGAQWKSSGCQGKEDLKDRILMEALARLECTHRKNNYVVSDITNSYRRPHSCSSA